MRFVKFLTVFLALAGCVGRVEVDDSAHENAPDVLTCDDPEDCPTDEACLGWRCSRHVCMAFVLGNAECRNDGGVP